jgi:uncharacterized protein (DUF1800 family)
MPKDILSLDPQWAWAPFRPASEHPWNRRLAAHLCRRAGFGANSAELDELVNQPPAKAVRGIVHNAVRATEQDPENDPLARAMLATGNPRKLAVWWLHRMLTSKWAGDEATASSPLLEKLALFWHGHFATSAARVDDADMMFAQNTLLRRHALADFGELVHQIARDPAMLIYLDSATNRKIHPNENFAREIMELFCLGEGNYSESDVQELARCFTGWEVRRDRFRFNRFQHDTGHKVILGQSGSFSGEDGVDVVLAQKALPEFIVGKLVRFFVFDEPAAPDHLIEPLAVVFRESNLQIAPLIERILVSNLFYSPHAIGRKVRSPVELGIGLLRCLEGSTNLETLARALSEIGQAVFYPPNVKGWDGGRAWINTSTLLGRSNLVAEILKNNATRFGGADLETLAREHKVTSPRPLVAWLDELLIAGQLTEESHTELVQFFNETAGSQSRRIAELIHTLSTIPQFQLA